MVRDFVQKYLDLYDIMEPFESVEERDNYQLQYVGESLTDFQGFRWTWISRRNFYPQ